MYTCDIIWTERKAKEEIFMKVLRWLDEHFEETPVDAEDHLKRQHPDEQAADQRDGPQRDGFKKSAVVNGRNNFRWQHSGLGLSKARCLHNGGDHPLYNVQQCQHQIHAVGDHALSKGKAHEQPQCVFRAFDFRQRTAGFHHTNHKEQHQQSIAYSLQSPVNAGHHIPKSAALEAGGGLGNELPILSRSRRSGTG